MAENSTAGQIFPTASMKEPAATATLSQVAAPNDPTDNVGRGGTIFTTPGVGGSMGPKMPMGR